MTLTEAMDKIEIELKTLRWERDTLYAAYAALHDHCRNLHDALHLESAGGYHRILHPLTKEKLN